MSMQSSKGGKECKVQRAGRSRGPLVNCHWFELASGNQEVEPQIKLELIAKTLRSPWFSSFPCAFLSFHHLVSSRLCLLFDLIYDKNWVGISANVSFANSLTFLLMNLLKGTNCTMSRRAVLPWDCRTPSSPSKATMAAKSASPTPTIMIDRGRAEASRMERIVESKSLITPSV